MLCAFWQRQKQPAQSFEIVRYLFVNGFEGSVLSSQDVNEMNQPRIHVFSRNDGTQDQFTEKEKTKCQPSSLSVTRSQRELRKFAVPGDGFSPLGFCSSFLARYA